MKRSGRKTLIMSIIMSSPGPLVVGLSLINGNSTTQLADFLRRTIEFLAIVLAFIVFCLTSNEETIDIERKARLEKYSNIFVSISMVISGIIMLVLGVFNQNQDKGNLIPSMIIALLGLSSNCIFWFKYRKMAKMTGDELFKTQTSLYGGKIFVDLSVFTSLTVVLFSKNHTLSYYFDLVGTMCVAIYLIYSGIKMLIKIFKK